MPIDRPTLQTIVNRIEADIEQRVTNTVPLLAVSFLRVLARVFAGAIHVLYGWLVWLSDALFYDTAETSMLDRHASLWGLTRKAATFATGGVDIIGTNGVTIAVGAIFVDENGIEVETTTGGSISGGTLSLTVTASESGTSGNLAAGTALQPFEPIVGLDSTVVDSSGLTGGQNEETDSELSTRIGERISEPPKGGTEDDFKAWAKEVDGVADAWAFGNIPSNGFVTVIVKASGTNPVPSPALLTQVETNIVANMPVTTNLIVDAIDDVLIDLTIDMRPSANQDLSDLIAAVGNNLTSYFDEAAEPGQDILISGIRNAISTTGIADYEITGIDKDTIAQSIDDISMSGFEYAILNSITYT